MLGMDRWILAAITFATGGLAATFVPSSSDGRSSKPGIRVQAFDQQVGALSTRLHRLGPGVWIGTVRFDDGRSQRIEVDGSPSLFGTRGRMQPVRRVKSTIWEGRRCPIGLMESVLAMNATPGAFHLETSDDRQRLVFRIDVPEATGSEFLEQAILTVAQTADEVERELVEKGPR